MMQLSMLSTEGRGRLHTTQSELERSHPYSAGSRLDLSFSLETGGSYPLSVEVVKPFEPFTSAVALLVRPRSSSGARALGLPSSFVVKINDVRHSIRDELRYLPPWSPSFEASLRSFVEHTKQGTSNQCGLDLEKAWDDETDNYQFRKECYDREVAAYHHLHTLQGRDIPRFYGTVRYPFKSSFRSSAVPHGADMAASILDFAEGMALEYIDGCNLAQAHANVNIPRADVERSSEATLQIMKHLRNLGLWHGDCRPENVLMRSQAPHNPVLIDFGISSIKRPTESLAQWMATHDEIQEMRYVLSEAGMHIESPQPEFPDPPNGYIYFNRMVERKSKEWRERFYDPVQIDGPGYVVKLAGRHMIRYEDARWKLKPGVKRVDDHRYD